MNDKVKPSWWLLDAVVIAIALALLAVQRVAPSPLVRQLLQAAAVVVGYCLMATWLHANAAALEAEEQRDEKAQGQGTTEASEIDSALNMRQKHFRQVMKFKKDRSSP